MLVTRTIAGTLKSADDEPIGDKTIKVRPLDVFGDGGVLSGRDVIKTDTDEDGAYSFDLLVSNLAGAFVRYECELPDEAPVSKFRFDLFYDDDPTSLDVLLNLSVVAMSSSAASLAILIAGKQDISEKGDPEGYASLDADGKVPVSQIPEFIVAGFIVGETPAGAINGSNATFTTANEFIPESVQVFVNGVFQRRVTDFNTSGTTTINLAASPETGERVLVNYQEA